MDAIIDLLRGNPYPLHASNAGISPVDEAWLKLHAPAANYALVRDGCLMARCSIWSESTPRYEDNSVGVIGHYAAVDRDAGMAILRHSVEQLHGRGFGKIVGPMDGNTWRRYRLLTQRGAEPPFFLEPNNPDDWPTHFESAGFKPLAHYFSALNADLTVTDPRAADALTRMSDVGIRIRSIEPSRFEDELKSVHALSLEAFADNFLYTPISQAEFLEMYAPLHRRLRPELVLLAEEENRLVGFMFGLPDLAQARRGEVVNTVIAKSMAVRPANAGIGLGGVLMDLFQQAAANLGYTRVIHALMHETNRSRKISARFGQPFRQYTLYAIGIDP